MIVIAVYEAYRFLHDVVQIQPKDDYDGADDANGKRWCVSDHLTRYRRDGKSCCELLWRRHKAGSGK